MSTIKRNLKKKSRFQIFGNQYQLLLRRRSTNQQKTVINFMKSSQSRNLKTTNQLKNLNPAPKMNRNTRKRMNKIKTSQRKKNKTKWMKTKKRNKMKKKERRSK